MLMLPDEAENKNNVMLLSINVNLKFFEKNSQDEVWLKGADLCKGTLLL